ncbi:hypothetical protein [Nocardia terpenica]|uniref:Uncharacterized protein n=1 Tax=Nocardia terpenica TaxID=455432 RepID=A0A161WD61_9NOCA|nr:hypothetical protein [Nocardia terpenica]KZM73826.1 hypothetical protein AWN90_35365 [Nocardia terpenica]KZM74899.1 hypothetical protein AWN90_23055 [Nocardia terpenica]NQE86903.1 hypothetical protein [Nocardia terpenica]NQE93443.1 hypothetical protein [Nocardia terpenica]
MQALQLQGMGDVVRPARLNAAGWCMWCLERGCSKVRCIQSHERSAWAVCPVCDGTEWSDPATATRCTNCMYGVVEIDAPCLSVVR